MDEIGAVQAVLDAIEAIGVPYMVVGSLASNAYGIAQSTQDGDIVLSSTLEGMNLLRERLPTELLFDPQASFEMVTGKTRHVIRLKNQHIMIDLFEIGDSPFDQLRFERRRMDTIEGSRRYA